MQNLKFLISFLSPILGFALNSITGTVTTDFFKEIFFGYGAWIMAIVTIVLIVSVSAVNKYIHVIMCPVTIFVGIWYFNNITVGSDLLWIPIFIWFTGTILILTAITRNG